MALTLDTAADHTACEVRAVLRTGAMFDQPYGLDLAGLLAAHHRRLDHATRRRDNATATMPDTTEEVAYDLPLPLARCITSNHWHWAATCAIAVDPDPDPDPRMFYRTTDTSWAARAATRPLPFTSASAGPYRDVMMSATSVVCAAIVWRAIGNIDAVRAAVTPIRFIGRRRGTGEGEILYWDVAETRPDDPLAWVHADGGTILRPCPVECAETLRVPYRLGWYALRPPSWHPDRLEELAMTDDTDYEDWFD